MYEEVEVNSERWFDLKPLKNEIWKSIVISKNDKLIDLSKDYQVSNYGRVKVLKRKVWNRFDYILKPEIILKARFNKKGYVNYILQKDGKKFCVIGHRITLNAFVKNIFNKPQVNHKNGIKIDNRLCNLEWCTNSENLKHALEFGLFKNKKRIYKYAKRKNISKKEIREKQLYFLNKYRDLAIEKASKTNSKSLEVYDKNGNFIKKFNSFKEAQNEMKITHIGEIISGKRTQPKNYILKEAQNDISKI